MPWHPLIQNEIHLWTEFGHRVPPRMERCMKLQRFVPAALGTPNRARRVPEGSQEHSRSHSGNPRRDKTPQGPTKERKKSRKSAKGVPKGTPKITPGGLMGPKGWAEGAASPTKSHARAVRGAPSRKKSSARECGRFLVPVRPFFGAPDPHDSMVFIVFCARPHFSGKARKNSGAGPKIASKSRPGAPKGAGNGPQEGPRTHLDEPRLPQVDQKRVQNSGPKKRAKTK